MESRKSLSETGVKSCISITTVQSLIVALNPFHNSMNYASVVLFGYTELVDDAVEKKDALTRITNEPFKNLGEAAQGGDFGRGDRWGDSITPSDTDMQVSSFAAKSYSSFTNRRFENTRVISFQIDTGSAKVRTGDPKDDKHDKDAASGKYWSGQIIKQERWVEVKPSPYCSSTLAVPKYIQSMLE